MVRLPLPVWEQPEGEAAVGMEGRVRLALGGQVEHAKKCRAGITRIADPKVLARRWGASRSAVLWYLSWARPVGARRCWRRGWWGGAGGCVVVWWAGGAGGQPGRTQSACATPTATIAAGDDPTHAALLFAGVSATMRAGTRCGATATRWRGPWASSCTSKGSGKLS